MINDGFVKGFLDGFIVRVPSFKAIVSTYSTWNWMNAAIYFQLLLHLFLLAVPVPFVEALPHIHVSIVRPLRFLREVPGF